MKNHLFLTVLIMLAVAACGSPTRPPDQPAGPQVSDPAKNLEATAGSEFKIMIKSNPSTGYHWELADKLDSSVVEFVSKDYKGSEPVMPGSGGVDVWTFKAISAGRTKITLGYYPPSNDQTEPQQTIIFTVIVK